MLSSFLRDVTLAVIAGWKHQEKGGMLAAFSGKTAAVKKDGAAKIEDLHAKIGQLTVVLTYVEEP